MTGGSLRSHLSQNPLPIKTQILLEIGFSLIVVDSTRDKATIIYVLDVADLVILITGQKREGFHPLPYQFC